MLAFFRIGLVVLRGLKYKDYKKNPFYILYSTAAKDNLLKTFIKYFYCVFNYNDLTILMIF